jgi:hypothetical protein
MTRRELIQKTTLALGYTLSAPAMMGILSGCEARHELSYKPVFFNEEQAMVIGDLVDIILPRTTTPGAKDVGVPSFIDSFVKEVYSKEEQEKFIKELDGFNNDIVAEHFRKFSQANPSIQKRYASEVHSNAISQAGTISEGWWNNSKMERPFILKVKELAIIGFFSSEAGATQVLQYNPAPGPYQGCVPLAKVGKAWAT